MVKGALGHLEEGKARMVSTPWDENKIPFEDAAEIGTRKVITEHSTIGILVTTDGSIGDFSREDYEEAEERTVNELKEIKKPFAVIVNSVNPQNAETTELVEALREKYDVPVRAVNCAKMNDSAIEDVFSDALQQFPPSEINFHFPGFIEGLSNEHWIKSSIIKDIKEWITTFKNMEQIKQSITSLGTGNIISSIDVANIDLGTGNIDVKVNLADGLYYKVVAELMDQDVKNDYDFFKLLREFSEAKKSYDKLKDAVIQVEEEGYGIVQPKLSEMVLEEPEVFKQGSKYGVRLKAKAPSLHIIKTDITTEISPIVGTEKQSEDLVKFLMEEFESDPSKIWDTNIFGKSLYEMVTEQMETKLSNVPENIRVKVQRSLQKISDEGKEYFICIII